jgi:hypothetical protein
MNLKLDPTLRAGDVARDLAAIGYVIKPDGTLTRRKNVVQYHRPEFKGAALIRQFGGAMPPGGGEAA